MPTIVAECNFIDNDLLKQVFQFSSTGDEIPIDEHYDVCLVDFEPLPPRAAAGSVKIKARRAPLTSATPPRSQPQRRPGRPKASNKAAAPTTPSSCTFGTPPARAKSKDSKLELPQKSSHEDNASKTAAILRLQRKLQCNLTDKDTASKKRAKDGIININGGEEEAKGKMDPKCSKKRQCRVGRVYDERSVPNVNSLRARGFT